MAGYAMLVRLPPPLAERLKVKYHVGTTNGNYPSALSFEGLRTAAVSMTKAWFEEASGNCLEMGRLALAFAPGKALVAFAALGYKPTMGTGATFTPSLGAPRGGRPFVGTPRGPPRPVGAPTAAPAAQLRCTRCGGANHAAAACNVSAAALAARTAGRPAAPPVVPRPRP
jgi:hypothetical protein